MLQPNPDPVSETFLRVGGRSETQQLTIGMSGI